MRLRSNRVIAVTLLASAAILPVLSSPVFGNVYPSGLQVPDTNIAGCETALVTYILNENADAGVTIDVIHVATDTVVRTVTFAAPATETRKGLRSWAWDGRRNDTTPADTGNYKFRITAADDGYTSWTQINVNGTQNNFYVPYGVDVNKNPNSPYFGRVYVSETTGGTTAAGRLTQDGLYLLNADGSDAVGQGNDARKGGVTWGGSSSPFRVFVGPDDQVYVTDWSDANSALWVGDADFEAAVSVFDNTGRAASGLCANHGSIPTVVVEGTGESRVIYTMDEDYPGATNQRGSIWRYDVGSSSGNYATLPTIVYDDMTPNNVGNYYNKLVRGTDGTWWATQNRSGGSADYYASLIQISGDGSTVLWKSIPSLGANSLADPLARNTGLALCPKHGYLAIATNFTGTPIGGVSTSLVKFFNPATKAVLPQTVSVQGLYSYNSGNRDVAFDAAGNLYVVNNIGERLRVYSPPDGANSFQSVSGEFAYTSSAGGPTISNQPESISSCSGAAVSFTVVASGSGTLTYQWYRNGSQLDGQVGASLALTAGAADAKNGDSYYVRVCDSNGVAASNTAMLTVYAGPTISSVQQPYNQAAPVGGSAVFTGNGTATAPPGTTSFQWYKVGSPDTPVPGATENVMTIANVSSADAGDYYLRVIDACGNFVNSRTVALAIVPESCQGFADTDGDDDVDMDDFGEFQTCYTGSTGDGFDSGRCRCFDRDGNSNVDQTDFAAFLACASGAEVPALEGCGGVVSLFADDFDEDHTADWVVNKAAMTTNGNEVGNIAEFYYDYSLMGIPSAPNSVGGTTRGLRLRANALLPSPEITTATGLSVSPLGQTFSGDFVIECDAWMNFNGPLPGGGAGSTQLANFGWGTAGTYCQMLGGYGKSPNALDSVLFSCTGDGQNNYDYRVYDPAHTSSWTDFTAVYVAGAASGAIGDRDARHPYYSVFGGAAVPAAQTALYPQQTGSTGPGAQAFQWRSVRIAKTGKYLIWIVDGRPLSVVDTTLSGTLGSGNIVLGQCDVNLTRVPVADQELVFTLIDNVRVTR